MSSAMLMSAVLNPNPSMPTTHGETSPPWPATIFIESWSSKNAMNPADRQAKLRDSGKDIKARFRQH